MQIAQGMKLCAAACLAATLMDTSAALPGRIEYAVNFGKESASVGRFLPVGSTYWQEGKSWNQIKNEIANTTSDYDKEKLQERLAKLSGGVAVLYVGAPSEVEMKEKKDRVDDALCATRAAIEEGIIPGGAVAYIRAQQAIEGMKGDNADEDTGIQIIRRAIEEPLRQIVENAGLEGSVVVNEVRNGKGDYGYNARVDKYENLKASGIIDPAKVTRVALENAASIAGMFLTTECVICEAKEDKPEMPMGGAPGMGGMM